MSSFFTVPASQRKRKRPRATDQNPERSTAPKRNKRPRDYSISGSDISDDDEAVNSDVIPSGSEDEDDEEDEFADEDPAAKRVRLAERYLAATQKEVLDDFGFDAAEVDQDNLRRRMGERLKEDSAESKGKLYRWIADRIDWSRTSQKIARLDGKCVTSVSVSGSHAYIASKDMAVSRWEFPGDGPEVSDGRRQGCRSGKPKRVAYSRGNAHKKGDRDFQHHHGPILCIAASEDGKFVATGGADNKLIVWDAKTMKPLKVFYQHRDSITGLAFRKGTNQLFSASKDRTIKIWSLDELAYVDTLFGHQDEVVDVSALAQEKCVTVGARDRTARLWKVVEESQLVFRGGGAPGKAHERQANQHKDDSGVELPQRKAYNEGSMDRVACIDDDTFITGSDNGSLSLWNIHKKKPVFIYPLAHGLEAPPTIDTLSAEIEPDADAIYREPSARWITALRAIPFSDVFFSGSWDGRINAWRITQDKRRIEPLGQLGQTEFKTHLKFDGEESDVESPSTVTTASATPIRGVINDISVVEYGEKGKEGFIIAAALGKEHRLGKWSTVPGAKNSLIIYRVPSKKPTEALSA